MPVSQTLFFLIAQYVGTVAFAASGAMLAIDRGLDLLGVIVLGVTTALGGGSLRDIIIGVLPPQMFSSPTYILIAVATSILIFIFESIRRDKFLENYRVVDKYVNVFDAIGLGVFTIVGVETAIDSGHGANGFLCIFLGVLTGVGGGMLRDVLSHEIPAILKKHVYALASIIGACLYFFFYKISFSNGFAVILSVLVVLTIRLLAAHYRWELPKVRQS